MLNELKNKLKIKTLKFKMNRHRKKWNASRKKESKSHELYKKYSNDYYYAVQNISPERTWEMRSERESLKLSFSSAILDSIYLRDDSLNGG